MPSVLYKQLHFCLGSQKLGEGEAARSTLVSAQVGLDWNHRVIVRGSCCGFLPTPPRTRVPGSRVEIDLRSTIPSPPMAAVHTTSVGTWLPALPSNMRANDRPACLHRAPANRVPDPGHHAALQLEFSREDSHVRFHTSARSGAPYPRRALCALLMAVPKVWLSLLL